jgi:hypothetical protein
MEHQIMNNSKVLSTIGMLLCSFVFPALLIGRNGSVENASVTSRDWMQDPQATASSEPLDKIKLVNADSVFSFIDALNANGKLGYRLYKSVNYGGEGARQSFAAVLRLDPANKYEYDFLSSPDKKRLEGRLNAQAMMGFNFATSYALTGCGGGEESDTVVTTALLHMAKGNAFLIERRNGIKDQSKEYKVFIAKVRLGDSAEKDLQKAIDGASPQGFRPVRILFSRQGLLDFSVSIMLERDLPAGNSAAGEYKFLKKTSGLPKDMSALAAQGYRFNSGRRVGQVGLVLMDKRASDATSYTFIDAKKYAKEFDKTVAAGNSYQGLMNGDLTCGSSETEVERLVFAQNATGEKHEYKILDLPVNKTGPTAEALAEFQRLLSENYQIRDLFYAAGIKVILER